MSPSPGSFSALQQFEHELTRDLRERSVGSRQQLRALFVVLTLVTSAAVLLGVLPAHAAVHVYLVVVVAIGAVIANARALSPFRRFEPRRRWSGSNAQGNSLPPFFERVQRRLELASTSNAHFAQLRPRLREVAENRLAGHGARLGSDAARELLGENAWALLERSRPGDKFDPGPEQSEIRELLEAVERI